MISRRSILAALSGLLACRAMGPPSAWAQRRPKRPPENAAADLGSFADPQKMWERLFGPGSEDEEKAIAQVNVSPREERQLGQAAIQAFLAELKRQGIRSVSRGREVQYLRDLVDTVRPMMANPGRYPALDVYLVESPVCEARSFPGGTLVFFRGLLESSQSEAALVGVVGHELSHLDRGHQLMRVKQLKHVQQNFSGGAKFSPDRFAALGTTMVRAFARPFRPEDESAADRDGAIWAYRAGYDPAELARFLARMNRLGPDLPPLLSFLQSHPDPQRRSQAVSAIVAELQKTDPKDRLYVGKENLRRRIARSRERFEE